VNQNKGEKPKIYPFNVRDCALVAIATGFRAQNLREFREGLLNVHSGSIYHHFWGRLMHPQFDEPEYNNDFAAWAAHSLHEKALAERLSMIDPADFGDIEDLRQELVEVVENRLDEGEMVPWAKSDQQFYFIRSQIVVLDTGRVLKNPGELARVIPEMSSGSIFYHFIDARRRTPDSRDDFCTWLSGIKDGYEELQAQLKAVDPYFSSLVEIRQILSNIFNRYFNERAR
jgi:hypothetical protein